MTRKPTRPSSVFWMCRPMSWNQVSARSSLAPLTAILNLRGRKANSGWKVLPLAQDLAQRARVEEFVGSDAGRTGSVVTLRMQLPEVWMACIWTFASSASISGIVFDRRPVELQVVARREVAVATVVLAAEFGEAAQLTRGEHAVGRRCGNMGHAAGCRDRLQAQRAELVVGQFARLPAPDLVAELRDAGVDEQCLVVVVVAVHGWEPRSVVAFAVAACCLPGARQAA